MVTLTEEEAKELLKIIIFARDNGYTEDIDSKEQLETMFNTYYKLGGK